MLILTTARKNLNADDSSNMTGEAQFLLFKPSLCSLDTKGDIITVLAPKDQIQTCNNGKRVHRGESKGGPDLSGFPSSLISVLGKLFSLHRGSKTSIKGARNEGALPPPQKKRMHTGLLSSRETPRLCHLCEITHQPLLSQMLLLLVSSFVCKKTPGGRCSCMAGCLLGRKEEPKFNS